MRPGTLLVAGCGFLGQAVARRFTALGWTVLGLTHSAATAEALAGEPFAARPCDIAERTQVEQLVREGPFQAVIHCASSGRGEAADYRRVYLEGAQNLLAVLKPAQFVYTSSTSVYAQNDASCVTEKSEAEPPRETGRLLRLAEEATLGAGGTVLRLSALYGPQRSVLLRKFLGGEARIEGDGARWLNQIHRDDAAAAFVSVIEQKAIGIFNVSDDLPTSQRAIYEYLANYFDRPLPPVGAADPHRKRGLTNKRVANDKLRALGWRPQYPSFFDALPKL